MNSKNQTMPEMSEKYARLMCINLLKWMHKNDMFIREFQSEEELVDLFLNQNGKKE